MLEKLSLEKRTPYLLRCKITSRELKINVIFLFIKGHMYKYIPLDMLQAIINNPCLKNTHGDSGYEEYINTYETYKGH